MPIHDSIPTDGPYDDEESEETAHHAADEISFQDTKSDQVLSSQVVAVLSELGHYNRKTNTYQLNHRDASSCLRDLIRFLRNDGPNFLVRRQMGISNVVNNDLLPILEQHTVNIESGVINEAGKSIMDKVIRLLVDLTNPTMLHYKNQQVPKEDKHEAKVYMELQELLFRYKVSFAIHKRFWVVLAKHLTHILALEETDRQVEDGLMFERIIVLIRNVLHIPVFDSSNLIDDDTSVQDRIIEQMHQSDILDILQYMIQAEEHKDFCFHLVEIIYLMFREQNAEFLAKSIEGDPLASVQLDNSTRELLLATSGRSQYERDCDRREIEQIRERDRQSAAEIMAMVQAKSGTARYARPTYVVKNMKSISDQDIICHQPFVNPEMEIDLNKNKASKIRARNRRPMQDNMDNSDSLGVQRIHRSNRKLRLILHKFCQKFLTDCYNAFMATLRSNLRRGSAQDHDETYYLWAMQFFMEFNRCRPIVTAEERYREVYETMATSTFHYLQVLVDDYLDHLAQKQIYKLQLADWSKRLHCALRSYRELLFTLASMDRLNLPEASKMSHRIKQDIFTEPEYREMLLRLLQAYNEERMSKAYLRDLIETNHLFLKLLDYHAKISYNFKVKVKKRKQKKRKSTKKLAEQQPNEGINIDEVENFDEPVNLDELWLELNESVLKTLNDEQLSEESIIGTYDDLRELFDQLSPANIEDQKLAAMRRVCQLLRKRQVEPAVRLFREARNVLAGLDSENAFGDIDDSPEDELLSLNNIMLVDFPEEEKAKEVQEEDEEENEDEEDFASANVTEAAFSIDDTVRRYAHPTVLRAYRLMLKNYRGNSTLTNHSIVRMLYRIAVDLKMVAMFYNFGFFLIFEKILGDPAIKSTSPASSTLSSNAFFEKSHSSIIKELEAFAHFVTRNFFKLLAKFPKVASELCFIANTRDAYSMELGWDEKNVSEFKKQMNKKQLWTDAQEFEIEVLYREFKDKAAKETDIARLIQERLLDNTKTNRQILKKLREMGFLPSCGTKKRNSKRGPSSSQKEENSNAESDTEDNQVETSPNLNITAPHNQTIDFSDDDENNVSSTELEAASEDVDGEPVIEKTNLYNGLGIFCGENENSVISSDIESNVAKPLSLNLSSKKRKIIYDSDEETPEVHDFNQTNDLQTKCINSPNDFQVENDEHPVLNRLSNKRKLIFDSEEENESFEELNVENQEEDDEPLFGMRLNKKKKRQILDDDED